jgi:hypothetical protein
MLADGEGARASRRQGGQSAREIGCRGAEALGCKSSWGIGKILAMLEPEVFENAQHPSALSPVLSASPFHASY